MTPAPLPTRFERLVARPAARYGLRAALLGISLVLAAVPFGLLLQQVVTEGPLTAADAGVAEWLNERVRNRPWVVDALGIVTDLGKPLVLWVVVGVPAVWLWRTHRRRLAVFLAVTSLGGGIVDVAVKEIVGRSRPVLDEPVASALGRSFPSGHAMSATVCYGALLLVFLPWAAPRARRWIVAAVVVVVAAVGVTRLALGVHYVTDIVGGYVLGGAWLVASTAAFEVWREERGRRRTEPLEEGVEPEEVDDPDEPDEPPTGAASPSAAGARPEVPGQPERGPGDSGSMP